MNSTGRLYVLFFLAFALIMAFCTNFQGELNPSLNSRFSFGSDTLIALWLEWWSDANNTQPNKDLAIYLSVYFVLAVAAMTGAILACWFVQIVPSLFILFKLLINWFEGSSL